MHKLAFVFGLRKPNNYGFEDMGEKTPTYLQFIKLLAKGGIETEVVCTKDYLGQGFFASVRGKNEAPTTSRPGYSAKRDKFDIAFDRSGGTVFPPCGDSLRTVDCREFKLLAWDKWSAYEILKRYMPKTFILDAGKLPETLEKIKGDNVVIKPVGGLGGKGIFIGSKKDATAFVLKPAGKYIVQEYIETGAGIPGITTGPHDLRVVVLNKKIVWSHYRTPPAGSLKANVATGGSLNEVSIKMIPENIAEISEKIAEEFYEKYDNPLFSVDFGVDREGTPYIFEINDQIGLPRPDALGKDLFLKELVANIRSKI